MIMMTLFKLVAFGDECTDLFVTRCCLRRLPNTYHLASGRELMSASRFFQKTCLALISVCFNFFCVDDDEIKRMLFDTNVTVLSIPRLLNREHDGTVWKRKTDLMTVSWIARMNSGASCDKFQCSKGLRNFNGFCENSSNILSCLFHIAMSASSVSTFKELKLRSLNKSLKFLWCGLVMKPSSSPCTDWLRKGYEHLILRSACMWTRLSLGKSIHRPCLVCPSIAVPINTVSVICIQFLFHQGSNGLYDSDTEWFLLSLFFSKFICCRQFCTPPKQIVNHAFCSSWSSLESRPRLSLIS